MNVVLNYLAFHRIANCNISLDGKRQRQPDAGVADRVRQRAPDLHAVTLVRNTVTDRHVVIK